MEHDSDFGAGVRIGLPVAFPSFALGFSFGVLARPVMGAIAPIVMSVIVYSGGAQFAALAVLQVSGPAGAAIAAGMLMNARWLPMSFAVAPYLRGARGRRAVEAQSIVDASFVMASRPDGTFDRGLLIGSTIPQAIGWMSGTAAGVVCGGLIAHPNALGFDAIFPAFYLALIGQELRQRRSRRVLCAMGLAAAIVLVLLPFAPAGLPIVAAAPAALIGLKRT